MALGGQTANAQLCQKLIVQGSVDGAPLPIRYLPGETLKVKALADLIGQNEDFMMTFVWSTGKSGRRRFITPNGPGMVSLRGSSTEIAPNTPKVTCEVTVYWIDKSGPFEAVSRILKRQTVTFERLQGEIEIPSTIFPEEL